MFDPADPRNMLFERDRSFIVFISSKMADGTLAAERRAVIDVVERFRPARAWAWERDAPAGSYYSKEECIRRAGTSDALVLVVEDELTPITEAEFDAARAGTANAIVLARSGVERSKRLARLIKDARRWAITKEFGDLDELESEVDLALWEWFVRGGRTLALQTRELRKNDMDAFPLDEVEMTDQNGQTVNLKNAIDGWRQEDLDDAERAEEILWELYGWAAIATDEDQFPLARVLLDELRKLIPAAAIDEVARGWILNLEGQIESGEGRRDPATQYFEQMRQIGVATDEKGLISIALQNLGIQAVIAGDHDLAKEHFRESFELKKETDDFYGATQIALNMCNVFIGEGSPQLARELLDDLEPYVRGPETYGLQAALHGQRGMVFKEEGLPDEAKRQFQESLRLARRADSAARQVLALQNLGANALERDKPQEALRWLRKALELAEALGDRNRVKTLRAATGTVLAELKKWQEAAEQFVVAAQIAADLGDVSAEARAWADVAACWSRLDRPEEAQKLIDQALSNPQADRDPDWRAGQLRNLAEVLEQLGKPEEAIQRLDEASRLAENAEQQDNALHRAAAIALAHPGLGPRALPFLSRSLELQRSLGTNADVAWRAASTGALLSESSQVAHAPRYFSMALRVFARNGDRRRAFYVRNDRAIALGRIGELGAAVKDMRAALQIAQHLGDRRLEFQAELNLGELERRRGRLSDAEAHELRALKLARRSSDESDQAAALNMLGLIRTGEDRLDLAEEAYNEALAIGRRQKVDPLQHAALGGLAGIAYRRGRWGEAVRRFQQAVRRHGDVNTEALAEDLGGLALSRAARGEVVEEEVQRLVDVSGVIGWDENAAEELAEGAALLINAGGDPDDAVSLAAAAVMCALRIMLVRDHTSASADDEDMLLLVHVLMKATLWMREHPRHSELKLLLVSEVKKSFDVEGEELDFLATLMEQAEEELSQVEAPAGPIPENSQDSTVPPASHQ